MRRRASSILALTGLFGLAVMLGGQLSAQPAPGTPGTSGKDNQARPGTAGATGKPAAITPQKFDHKAHQDRAYPKTGKKVVSDDNCSSCHGSDARGALATPAKSGHQPCLATGCHVKWFVSIGPETQKRDPVLRSKAIAFCLGCHASASSEPPSRFSKVRADAVYKNNETPDYHVDFDHLDHTKRTACRDCHLVNDKTFALEIDTPGHGQCAACHGVKDDAEPMSQCASCHTAPAPREYFQNAWKGSETRSCGSPSHLELAAKQKKSPDQVPCFKHEREEHRFRNRGRDRLECGECHFMIGNSSRWGSNRYGSVREIKSAPIIHNEREQAHNSCGESRACHKRDVDDSRGTAACLLCHSQKTIDNDLFEP